MRHTWVSRIVTVTLVGGLCLVGYGLAHADKPIKPRFSVLSKDPAWVLDHTTSVQWQKAPGSTMAWSDAVTYCTGLGDGARLPEVKELISLVDYSVASPGPVLPPGHPFTNVQSAGHWSASTSAGNPSFAWVVNFGGGDVYLNDKTNGNIAWCCARLGGPLMIG